MTLKLNRLAVERILKALPLLIFTPQEFKGIFNVPLSTAQNFIKRNIKSGLFLKLRNNYYQLQDSDPSVYVIANKLYQPSYISLEKALSHYGIIPEIVYTITSVTTKPTQEFVTPKSTFLYQKIKREAYCGYSPTMFDGNVVFFAEPEKALADYLYFVDLKKISLNDRINLASINKSKLIRWARYFNRPSLLKLIMHIYVESRKLHKIY